MSENDNNMIRIREMLKRNNISDNEIVDLFARRTESNYWDSVMKRINRVERAQIGLGFFPDKKDYEIAEICHTNEDTVRNVRELLIKL